jgi:hypothetical protein
MVCPSSPPVGPLPGFRVNYMLSFFVQVYQKRNKTITKFELIRYTEKLRVQ